MTTTQAAVATKQAIFIVGLTKSYGDQEVLKGVDLCVPRQRFRR